MLERTLIDKENNANHINITCRRRKKMVVKDDRIEPARMEATFNPLPKISSGNNIPSVASRANSRNKTIEIEEDLFEGIQLQS